MLTEQDREVVHRAFHSDPVGLIEIFAKRFGVTPEDRRLWAHLKADAVCAVEMDEAKTIERS